MHYWGSNTDLRMCVRAPVHETMNDNAVLARVKRWSLPEPCKRKEKDYTPWGVC